MAWVVIVGSCYSKLNPNLCQQDSAAIEFNLERKNLLVEFRPIYLGRDIFFAISIQKSYQLTE